MSRANSLVDCSFQLLEQLGEGGMGAVFRAVHVVDSQVVALKLVTAEQTGSAPEESASLFAAGLELRLALAREFQTLASLHHPNIIRVQSYGFDEKKGSYFTMELLEKSDNIVKAASGNGEVAAVRLVAQLLRALSYIHRRGVIHRDIKPGNVLVAGDEVKLLDFGIATDLFGSFAPAGTPEYMAPELLYGAPPSVASDLYAVGLILHQALSQHLPMTAESLSGSQPVFADQPDPIPESETFSFSQPPSFSTLGGLDLQGFSLTSALHKLDAPEAEQPELLVEIPGPLGDVVRRLVHRNPAQRYQDADTVLAELAQAAGVAIPIETAETRESILKGTILIGRDDELAALRQRLDSLRSGTGGALLVGGESGVGKSRLLAETRTLALVYGFWVAEGQSVSEGGSYYQEWLPLLRALCLRVEVTAEEAAVLKLVIPDVATLLETEVADPPAVKAEELETRLAATLRALLGKLTKPLLLILEDLHWARSETISLLNELCQRAATRPLLVIATFRSDERPELPKLFPGLPVMALLRLGHGQIATLSESMLGAVGRQPELVDYLQRQTEGNVFFLIEIVRALAQDVGGLQLIGQGARPEALLTTGIERIVERRVDQVDAQYRPVLDFAATLGRKLDLAVLQQAFPTVSLRLLLVHCANAAVLESQGAEWRFAHDKLREAIRRRQSPHDRIRLNRQVAEAIEKVYVGDAREGHSGQLAYHFEHAQEPARALGYYVLAGDRASRLGLLAESRGHYRAALGALAALGPRAEEPALRRQRIDLLLKLMQCSLAAESLEVQLQRASEAQAILDSLGESAALDRADRLRQVRIDYSTGRAYYYVGQTVEAIRRYQRVLPLAQEFGDAELTAMPAAVIGMALLVQGHIGKSYQMVTRAIGPLRQLGNQFEVLRCQQYEGLALSFMGQYTAGLQLLTDGEARAKALGQPQLVLISKLFQIMAHHAAMDWASVLALAEPLGAAVEKLGERIYGAIAWSLAAWAHAHLEHHDLAKSLRTKALSLLAGRTQYLAADWFAAGDAECALLAGQYEEAVAIAQELLPASRAAGLPLSWGTAERCLGGGRARLGFPADVVDAHLAESLRVFTLGDLTLNCAQTYVVWSDCCRRRGDLEDAARHLAEAVRLFTAGGCGAALSQLQTRFPT